MKQFCSSLRDGGIQSWHCGIRQGRTKVVDDKSSRRLIHNSDKGVAGCVEAKTGEEVWKERLGGGFSASPIYADGKLFFFNEEGSGFVVAAGRKFQLLATNKLADGCMASPAALGKTLFVRTRTHLYRIEQK